MTEDAQYFDTDDEDGRYVSHRFDGEAIQLGETFWYFSRPKAIEERQKAHSGVDRALDEQSNKICHSLEFSIDFSCRHFSCGKTLKGREAEDNPWQSDEGVGHELDSLRIQDATWSLEQFLSCPSQRAFIWNVPGKTEISPSVEESEKEAKDQRLEEASCAPVRSVIFYFPPQGSRLETIALIQLLK